MKRFDMIILSLGAVMMLMFLFIDIPSGAEHPNLGIIYTHHIPEIAAFSYAGYYIGRNLEKEIKKKVINIRHFYLIVNIFLGITVPLVLMVSMTTVPLIAGKTHLVPEDWNINTVLFYSFILGWLPFYAFEGLGLFLRSKKKDVEECRI